MSNKLSIYLIKEEHSPPRDALKDPDHLKREKIKSVGDFYYGESHVFTPSWVENFFGKSFDNKLESIKSTKLKVFNASSKAILFVRVESRIFALTFGYGRALLKPGCWEERFGLKIALNIMDLENVRMLDKKNMSIVPKISIEQITKAGKFSDFGIDIEQDLIQGVAGRSKDEKFGKTITGRDALSVSVEIDVSNVKKFLRYCYATYKREDYKNNFDWIDYIADVKDPKKVDELNNELLEKIKKKERTKIWMSVPEIIDWEDVLEFKLGRKSLGDDIGFSSYINLLTDKERENLSLKKLKYQTIDCISSSSESSKRS